MGAAGLGGYLAVRSGSTTSAAAPALQHAVPLGAAAPAQPASAESLQPAPRPEPAVRPEPSRIRQTARPRSTPQVASVEPPPAPRSRPSPAPAAAPRFDQPLDGPVSETPAQPERATEPRPDFTAISASEPPSVSTPAPPALAELTVAENSVIGIRFESAVSTETSRAEDAVTARVTRDVTVEGRTAIPAGATLEGAVSLVQSGSSFKERARIGVQFTTMVLPDKTRVPIRTETIFRDGDAPGGEAASKIGASAVVGAVAGAVFGGRKGAVIGGTAGAAGGTAMVVAGGPNHATIPAGTPLTVRLSAPMSVSVPQVEP